MRLRLLLLALTTGAGLFAAAAPASAQCDPVLIESGDQCANGCMDMARTYQKLDGLAGGALPDDPFLCTQ